MLTYSLVLQTIASLTGIATSTSMIIAYRQLRLASRNSQLTFEDNLAREYRQLGGRVPLRAVLGEPLSEEEMSASLPSFFWYFDLSNEQAFLRRHGRVSDLTWETWAEGIRANMARPAFAQAWERITAAQPGLFAELRRFIDGEAVRSQGSGEARASGDSPGGGGGGGGGAQRDERSAERRKTGAERLLAKLYPRGLAPG